MKIVFNILTVLIGLLSIAAGFAKITLVPAEVEFLGQFGFTGVAIMTFGAVQVLGGILLVIPVTRFYGASIAAIAFALSAILLLSAGDLAFAGVSLIPVVVAALIAYKSFSVGRQTTPAE